RAVDVGANQAVLSAIAGRTVTLGIVPANDVSEEVMQPASTVKPASSPLVYEIATGQLNGDAPVYQRLNSISDSDPLTTPTLVQLMLPGPDSIGTWSLGPLGDGTEDF